MSDEQAPTSNPSYPRGRRSRVLFVGAFAERSKMTVVGGNLAACRALLASSLPREWDLTLLDSTMRSIPPPPAYVRAFYALGRTFRFVSLMIRHRPDAALILSSSGFSFLEKGMYAVFARTFGVPSLLWIRDGRFFERCRHPSMYRFLARTVLKVPRFLLCQGESWKRFYTSSFGIPGERCPVVENWLDPSYLEIGARRTPRITAIARVLYLGWLERHKGLFELLQAAALLAQDGDAPLFHLVLVGDGRARAGLEQWVLDHGLADRVSFTGWLTGSDKASVLADADLFVFPSHVEGLPNALLEAMAAALPVVVTPVGCVPDIIVERKEGLIVPIRDPAALAGAIKRLITHPDERVRMGLAAYQTAKVRFNVERAVRQLSCLLRQAIGESS